MTALLSGFFTPDVRAAAAQQGHPESPGQVEELAPLIHHTLNSGPMTLSGPNVALRASPRAILATIDHLQPSRLLSMSYRGDEEILELTDAGRRTVNP